MCRNLKPLFNLDPPATKQEIHAAAMQYVRKISGFPKPSKANEEVYTEIVKDIEKATRKLFKKLVTKAPPRNRENLAEKAKKRFENSQM